MMTDALFWVFFMQKRLDKERIIWYTNSVVNKRGLKIML